MPVDRVLIKERLSLIKSSLQRLERLARTPKDEFIRPDSDLPAVAESHLRRSLEAMFDIGRHILARTGYTGFITEYKGIARGLVEAGIVDRNLQETLAQMAGYRNRLVHFYHLIDNEELYTIITTRLEDIRTFVNQFKDYLNRA